MLPLSLFLQALGAGKRYIGPWKVRRLQAGPSCFKEGDVLSKKSLQVKSILEANIFLT